MYPAHVVHQLEALTLIATVKQPALSPRTIKHGPSKGPQTPHYKHEPQSVLEKADRKLYSERANITDHTIHNNRTDTLTFL